MRNRNPKRYEKTRLEDKPYRFVSLTGEPIKREFPAGHDDYEENKVTGMLRGVITALTPVHVGSGQIELTGREPPLVKAHVRSSGRPIIPGSSLKGAIRSIVEAISPSCICITRAKTDRIPSNLRGCTDKEKLCVACRMFGATGRQWGYQGQVRFSDAVLRDGFQTVILKVPPLYAPRPKERLYYEGGLVRGRKFYRHGRVATGNVPVEACPEGSEFDFTVHFDNLTEAELGLLLIALGQGEPPLTLKLGGAKPACFGSVRITLSEMRIIDDARAACADYDVPFAEGDLARYLEAAQELVFTQQLQELAKILEHPSVWRCPKGAY